MSSPRDPIFSWLVAHIIFIYYPKEAHNVDLYILLCPVGMAWGSVIAFALSGYLCDHGFAGGWPSIFHTYGEI